MGLREGDEADGKEGRGESFGCGVFGMGFSKRNGRVVISVRAVCQRHPCRMQTNRGVLAAVSLGYRTFR